MTAQLRNECPNPYAVSATTGATVSYSAGSGTLAQATGLSGSWTKTTGYKVTKSTAAGDINLVLPGITSIGSYTDNNWSITFQWSVSAVPTGALYLVIGSFNSSGTFLGNIGIVTASTPVANTVYTAQVTGSSTFSGQAQVKPYIYITGAPNASTATVTAIRLANGADSALTYADGSTSGWKWEGTTGASTSTFLTTVTASDSFSETDTTTSSTANNTNPSLFGNNWANHPTGSALTCNGTTPYTYDSGPSVYPFSTDTSYVTNTFGTGLANTWATGTSSTAQAIYIDQPTNYVIKYMTATWAWGADCTNTGAPTICIASWDQTHAVSNVNAQIHFSISRAGWFYYVVNTLSNVVLLQSGTFSTTLSTGTKYTASVSISGNTASLTLPDGTTQNVTDSRIGSYQGYTQCFEYYRNNNTFPGTVYLYSHYAGPGYNTLGLDSATVTDSASNNTTPGFWTGTDTFNFTDSPSLVTSILTTDTFTEAETITNRMIGVLDNPTLTESNPTSTVTTSATDAFSAVDTYSFFTNYPVTGTDSGHLTESTNLNVTLSSTDTASTADVSMKGLSSLDAVSLTDFESLNLLASDSFTTVDAWVPGEETLFYSDIFSLAEQLLVTKEFSADNDPMTLIEQASVENIQVYTEDPFVYPNTYYGGSVTRVIAQDVFTREFLHWDLPVDNLQITFSLSGPNVLQATLSTEMASAKDIGLEPYRTLLHVENDGEIIASFYMTPFIDSPQDQTRQIEGDGFSAYPSLIFYEGDPFYGVQVDPADMIRKLWDHCQSYPDGNLDIRVWNTKTPVRIGYPNTNASYTDHEGNSVSVNGAPYALNFWSAINCGDEINKLAQQTPIDYIEYSRWNATKSDVELYVVLGYPRVGRKRTDLSFREGENLEQLIPSYQESPDNYASDVFVIGAGNGPYSIRAKYADRIGRLRKTNIIHDQNIISQVEAQSIAYAEFARISKSRYLIESILVDTTHLNARWGTFIQGDDIYIQCNVPYVGYVQDWYRIVSYTYDIYGNTAALSLMPSGSFAYGATNVDPSLFFPKEGYAVLSNTSVSTSNNDTVMAQSIYNAQFAAINYYNTKGIKSGYALAYNDTLSNSLAYLMPIGQCIEPYVLIIARNEEGNLITGDNVYLVSQDGTVGQSPSSTGTTSTTDSSGNTVNPNNPGLILAAQETENAYLMNFKMDEGLRWNGMSQNATYWNPYVSQIFYANGGTYADGKPSTNLYQIMAEIIGGEVSYSSGG